jgi:hypothetical protein
MYPQLNCICYVTSTLKTIEIVSIKSNFFVFWRPKILVISSHCKEKEQRLVGSESG